MCVCFFKFTSFLHFQVKNKSGKIRSLWDKAGEYVIFSMRALEFEPALSSYDAIKKKTSDSVTKFTVGVLYLVLEKKPHRKCDSRNLKNKINQIMVKVM